MRNIRHNTWVAELKSILIHIFWQHVWDSNSDNLKNSRQGIRKHMANWYISLSSREIRDWDKNLKLRLQINIKQGFMVEQYLYINVAKNWIAISRLRLSWHQLENEAGRHA